MHPQHSVEYEVGTCSPGASGICRTGKSSGPRWSCGGLFEGPEREQSWPSFFSPTLTPCTALPCVWPAGRPLVGSEAERLKLLEERVRAEQQEHLAAVMQVGA